MAERVGEHIPRSRRLTLAARAGASPRKVDGLRRVLGPRTGDRQDALPGSAGTLTIHHTRENGGPLPELAAAVDGTDVGWITWAPDGTVAAIGVLQEYQHRGIATALWRAAQQQCPLLRHDGEHITEEGLAFALAIGGPWSTPTPPRRATLD